MPPLSRSSNITALNRSRSVKRRAASEKAGYRRINHHYERRRRQRDIDVVDSEGVTKQVPERRRYGRPN
jgi:hypothetical protein